MLKNRGMTIVLSFLFMVFIVFGPVEMSRISVAIDVTDGTLEDWDDAPVQLYDDQGETSISQTDLAYGPFIGRGLLLPLSSGSPSSILMHSRPTTSPFFSSIFTGWTR